MDKMRIKPRLLEKISRDSQNRLKQSESREKLRDSSMGESKPPILLPYQRAIVNDRSDITILVKSRRIGGTHAAGAWLVLEACRKVNPINGYYIGTSKEMTRDFLITVAYWIKAFGLVASITNETLISPSQGGDETLVFRAKFANGKEIVALSSKPSAIRGKGGNLIIDEAAFNPYLNEALKAASAMRIWGGKVRIISTHNGVDNDFNRLINRVKSGELNYNLLSTTLHEAVEQGLYERICTITNKPYRQEDTKIWVDQMYREYGIGADEELGCIPMDIKGGGKIFKREWWQYGSLPHTPVFYVRFWDMASTARDLKEDAYYSATVKMCMGYGENGEPNFWIVDADARQLSPGDGDDWIVEMAHRDGKDTWVRWELEGGSAGLKVANYLKDRLWGFNAMGVKPQGDKVTRAKPFASEVLRGNVTIVGKADDGWVTRYVDSLYGFDGSAKPLVNDLTDASSGCYASLVGEGVSPLLLC